MANKSLDKAKRAKNDEFYTQLSDIENELKHYKDQLRGKVVFCNCDDPFESNFFKYFAMNFNQIGLKKLIATCYDPSPIANTQLSLFGDDIAVIYKGMKKSTSRAYKIELGRIEDMDGSGSISIPDVEKMLEAEKVLLKSGKQSRILTYLEDDGDFRSDECVELLKQSDVVITNPPFSLFREYIDQLVIYDKKFLVIGNKNAITYKDMFRLIQESKLWVGYRRMTGGMWMMVPESGENFDKVVDGIKLKNVPSCWFTNLYVDKSSDPIIPYIRYEDGVKRGLYPKYDNYDAIEVSKVSEIPDDYDGVMGVPITFLDKYTPDSDIEIVKFRKGDDDKDLIYTERERERRTQPYFRILIRYRRAGQIRRRKYDA
jgi:hypothetical protein